MGMMRAFHTILLAALALAAATAQSAHGPGYSTLVQEAKTRIKEITLDEFKTLRAAGEKFVLVDVREDNEWVAGHAAGALHIGRGVLEAQIEGKVPEKDSRLVLYCRSGGRSALAADTLQKMGYTKVASLAGGITAYEKAGLAMEK
jgi:rhodanese-related sulfurtransferase